MSQEVVRDDVDLALPRLRLDDRPRKATNSSLVWLRTALPSTSPVWLLSAVVSTALWFASCSRSSPVMVV